MRIVLIQPDSPYLTYPLAFPSLGLLYISAYLKRNGIDHDFYDLTGGKELPNIYAGIFAFSCQITQFQQVRGMRNKLLLTNPKARFVIGGPFPTHSPEMCEGFEVIQGEGEIQFLNLIIGGNEQGYVDPNFFPNWDAIDLSRYGYLLEGKNCVNIMTKRGNCPYHCAFCAKQEKGKSPLRFRTAESVLQEVDLLREKGFEAVAIYDDDVLINKRRDYKIFTGLKERGMPYRCMTRTNLANESDLQILKDTGCAEVAIGIETADQKIHTTIKKGTTLEQDRKFVELCKKIGLRVKTYFIIGLPGENPMSVAKTRIWLRYERPDNYDLSIFTPYPGSDIYQNPEQYDIFWYEPELRRIWFSGEAQYGNCAVWTSSLTSDEILQFKKEIDSEFKRGKGGQTDYWKPK